MECRCWTILWTRIIEWEWGSSVLSLPSYIRILLSRISWIWLDIVITANLPVSSTPTFSLFVVYRRKIESVVNLLLWSCMWNLKLHSLLGRSGLNGYDTSSRSLSMSSWLFPTERLRSANSAAFNSKSFVLVFYAKNEIWRWDSQCCPHSSNDLSITPLFTSTNVGETSIIS